jgi:hypothetical protein
MERLGLGFLASVLIIGCRAPSASGPDCSASGGAAAVSTCLTPHQSMEYYAAQSNKYFDTIDSTADRQSIPIYSELVARWEWPPWLKLTAYGKDNILQIDAALIQGTPSPVVGRDCRGFRVQPFGRCRVSFAYEGGPCPIYEEFTFNDAGEMTFIEAWSDLPGLLPTADASDRWAEHAGVHRLSTKVPGLGSATGQIDLDSAWMQQAADHDPEIGDFVTRARNFWPTWTSELQGAGPDLYQRGCGWAPDAGTH